MLKFKCSRCGVCCSNLLSKVEDSNIVFGLYLTPKEVKYFPKDLVFPLFRKGDNIFAYQVGANICPNLFYNECRIYENRPLGCKTFPLKYTYDIDFNLCTFVKEHKGGKWDMKSFETQIKAIKEQIKEAEVTPEATEMYLFEQKKWIRYDGH